MKLIIKYSWLLVFLLAPELKAQQTGTVTVTDDPSVNTTTIIATGDYKGRDEVDVIPTGVSGEVHLTPQVNSDNVHLFVDPSLILSTTYASGGINTGGTIRPLDVSLPVGSTPGSYAISNGVLIYSIPIVVPPGTAGMNPNISVEYNSNSSFGILGDGWGLNCVSSVSRVNKNLYHNAVCDAVQLDANDAFSLDGNRLISSGVPNSFVSENENFSLITYDPSNDLYLVKTKDGKTLEYGSTANSKMQFTVGGTQTTYVWYLTKIYDNYNNTILYTYLKNPSTIDGATYNEMVISQIDYTINDLATPKISAYNSVKFEYEQRSDIDSKYIKGNLIGSTLLLREIEVNCENVMMKRYEFNYGKNEINESFLNEIKEYGSDNSNLNSTAIQYKPVQSPASGVDIHEALNSDGFVEPVTDYSFHTPQDANLSYYHQYIPGDFNGDGRTDLLGLVYGINSDGSFSYSFADVFINNDNGLSYTRHTSGINLNNTNNFGWDPISNDMYGFITRALPSSATFNVVDVDGDGMDDIVMENTGNIHFITYDTYLSIGTGFQLKNQFVQGSKSYFAIGDVDGDGLPEGILHDASIFKFEIFDLQTGAVHATTTINNMDEGEPGVGISTVDFDGDGTSEFITCDGKYFFILDPKFNSSGVLQSVDQIYKIPLQNSFNVSTPDPDRLMVCDFNGDHISDYIISPANASPYVLFGTGTAVTAPSAGVTFANAPGHATQVTNQNGSSYRPSLIDQTEYVIADVNGDSKSDLVLFASSSNSSGAYQYLIVSAAYGGGNINNVNQLTGGFLPAYGSDPSTNTLLRGFMPTYEHGDDKSYIPEFCPGDFDGDGTQDIMFKVQLSPLTGASENTNSYMPHDNTTASRIITNPFSNRYPGSPTNAIQSITDGSNLKATFTYNSISSLDYSNVVYIPLSANPLYNTPNTTHLPRISGGSQQCPFYNKGTSSAISYPTVQFQKPLNLVTGVVSDNGIGGTSTTTYTYTDAEVQMQGRGFLGFGSITATNADEKIKTVSTYTTISAPVTGNLLVIERVPLSTSIYTLSPTSLVANTSYTTAIILPNNAGSTTLQHFVATTKKEEKDVLKNVTTTTDYAYETLNNYTDNNLASYHVDVNGLESVTAFNIYQTINSFAGIPCRLCTTSVSAQRGSLHAFSGSFMSYNDQGKMLTKRQNPSDVFPAAPPRDKEVDINYTYDTQTGVLISSQTSAPNDPALPAAKINSYDYDTYKRFVTTSTNPLNQTIQTTYNPFWGTPLTVTGIDGLVTGYTYDGYGRKVSCTTPDNLIVTYKYEWVGPGEVSGDPVTSHITIPNIPSKMTASKPGSPTIIKYFDILGRNVRTKTEGLQNPYYSFTSYNSKGLVAVSTGPYEIGGGSGYAPIFDTYDYNVFGQVKTITRTDGTSNIYTTSYGYAYDVSTSTETITITPPDNNSFKEIFDASGLKVGKIDNNNVTVNYVYDANHSVIQVNSGSSNLATITYDPYGRQNSIVEPNTSTTTYEYNAYGLLYTQTDNMNNQYTYLFDELDRVKTITQTQGGIDVYTYNYNITGNGKNLLHDVGLTGSSNSSTTYSYDNLNRLTEVLESTNGGLSTKYQYDAFNNISKITYPGNFSVDQTYNAKGYLTKVNRADDGSLIWQVGNISPLGQYMDYLYGNGVSTTKTYDNYGYPVSVVATKGASTIQHLGFTFDQANGNLKNRKDFYNPGNTLQEGFTYDNLNRLLQITDTYGAIATMQYADNGNIMLKPDVGSYTYNTPQQNQVLTVSNPLGEISSNTRNLTYNSFKKAQNITESDPSTGVPINQLNFTYGPEQQRREADLVSSSGPSSTFYSKNYDKQVVGSNITEINYIQGGDGLCAMFVKTPADNGKIFYVHKDHLGSILTLSDDQGNVSARQSFDAWGQPRDPDTWMQFNAVNPSTNNTPGWLIRGYTGHEHLPEFSLINMNGRIYDPLIARVLSADNYVGNDGNLQDYNRYSYCKNNPLNGTDPTGELEAWDDAIVLAVGFIVGDVGYASTHRTGTGFANFLHDATSTQALEAGLLTAGAAEAGYLTLGGGSVAVGSTINAEGATLTGAAAIENGTRFAAFFALEDAQSIIGNQTQISQATGNQGVALVGGYGAIAALNTGLGSDYGEDLVDNAIFEPNMQEVITPGTRYGKLALGSAGASGERFSIKYVEEFGGPALLKGVIPAFINGASTEGLNSILSSYNPAAQPGSRWEIEWAEVGRKALAGGLAESSEKFVENVFDTQYSAKDKTSPMYFLSMKFASKSSSQVISSLGDCQPWYSDLYTTQGVDLLKSLNILK